MPLSRIPAELATTPVSFRNRIINGDMRIDQRNNGASITLSGAEARYPVDRFNGYNDTDGTVTAQQVAEAPAGFVNSSKLTVTTADASIGATQRTTFRQRIEGLNVSDLGWGTAIAQAVTLSFWVKSSVTGTHGGSIMNSSADYSYPFTYAISVANTWEFKTITIAGPTAGTWLTTNGTGLQVIYGLAMGSTYSGTAGSWSATRYEGATGAVQVTSTLNATWYITGVQLEAGSVASPFERRDYGRELIMCCRYFQKTYNIEVAIGTVSGFGPAIARASASTQAYLVELQRFVQVSMRATPTVTAYSPNTGASGKVHVSGSDVTVTSMNDSGTYSFGYPLITSTPSAGNDCRCHYVASAEL